MAILAENKRAHHDYEILEKYEAGIKLTGFEVKSARAGRMNIFAAYAVIRGSDTSTNSGSSRAKSRDEAWLLNASIAPFQPGNTPADYEQDRTRKLLLKKSEIKELLGKLQQKRLTFLPLKVYTKGRNVKVELGLCRGRRKYEKRERIKQMEAEREIARTLKQY